MLDCLSWSTAERASSKAQADHLTCGDRGLNSSPLPSPPLPIRRTHSSRETSLDLSSCRTNPRSTHGREKLPRRRNCESTPRKRRLPRDLGEHIHLVNVPPTTLKIQRKRRVPSTPSFGKTGTKNLVASSARGDDALQAITREMNTEIPCHPEKLRKPFYPRPVSRNNQRRRRMPCLPRTCERGRDQ